jgi:predicted Zn-dependent protease
MPRKQLPKPANPVVILSLAMMTLVVISLGIYGVALKISEVGVEAVQQAESQEGGAFETILEPPPDLSPYLSYHTAARWNSTSVTYSMTNCPQVLDCAQASQAVRTAMAAWQEVSGLTIREMPSGGDIEISWQSGELSDGISFDGPGGVLAQAAPPYQGGAWWQDGIVRLDDDENWVLGAPDRGFPDEVHLPTILLHEFGHALGLDHSEIDSALMWWQYTGVRGLAQDDILAIQSLYGSPGAEGLAVEPAEQPPVDAAVTARPTSNMNLRIGPSTGYTIIGRVPLGQVVPVIGRTEDQRWLLVESGGEAGWIAGWYCEVEGSLADVPVRY